MDRYDVEDFMNEERVITTREFIWYVGLAILAGTFFGRVMGRSEARNV